MEFSWNLIRDMDGCSAVPEKGGTAVGGEKGTHLLLQALE
jgi:hypothetical protein